MDTREEQEFTIQVPHDGSQTERTRGTYGGRQRWLNSGSESKSGANSVLSPRTKTYVFLLCYFQANINLTNVFMKINSKLTASSVYTYLNSLGISGEEHDMVNKEVNEVSIIRKVRLVLL
jgi:hypothetical protein